jgi:hypothetical protein
MHPRPYRTRLYRALAALAALVALGATSAQAQGIVTPDTEPSLRTIGKSTPSSVANGSATVDSRSMATNAQNTVPYGAPGSTASAGPEGDGATRAQGAPSGPWSAPVACPGARTAGAAATSVGAAR